MKSGFFLRFDRHRGGGVIGDGFLVEDREPVGIDHEDLGIGEPREERRVHLETQLALLARRAGEDELALRFADDLGPDVPSL